MNIAEKHEQTMTALERANAVRLRRAALKRRIDAGDVDLVDLLEPGTEVPIEIRTMTIGELLCAQHRWGVRRMQRLLFSVAIGEAFPVGRLTDRQRRLLVQKLRRAPVVLAA